MICKKEAEINWDKYEIKSLIKNWKNNFTK